MIVRKKFAVIGGDFRNKSLVTMLKEAGFDVKSFAFGDGECSDYHNSATLEKALEDVDSVIAPIPFTTDGKTLNTPLFKEDILINNFIKLAGDRALVIGGRFNEEIYKTAKYYSCKLIDILLRDDFAMLNAIPTAEGAIQIAMEETLRTINRSNVIIAGFGRIGKVLSKILLGMGAKVNILSRNSSEIAYASTMGIEATEYSNATELVKRLSRADIIFNTVPKMIFNYELLSELKPECLLIDLASKPGGVDFEKARELSVKTIWALSLPGKVAPKTSAQIVYDTVINILKEMEGE